MLRSDYDDGSSLLLIFWMVKVTMKLSFISIVPSGTTMTQGERTLASMLQRNTMTTKAVGSCSFEACNCCSDTLADALRR